MIANLSKRRASEYEGKETPQMATIEKQLAACTSTKCAFVHETNGDPAKLRPYLALIAKKHIDGSLPDIHTVVDTILTHFTAEVNKAVLFNLDMAGICLKNGIFVMDLPQSNDHLARFRGDLDELILTGGTPQRRRTKHTKKK
jgi:hypothetical protein